ncbi:hypothetical protein REPUB_Repub08aG0028300 [Reevesia pubescens]
MILYAVYKNQPKKMVETDPKLQLLEQIIVDIVKLGPIVCSEVNVVAPHSNVDTNNNNGGIVEAQNIKGNTMDACNKV